MTNSTLFLEIVCALLLASFTSYVGGRVHQWRRQYEERKTAFSEGFLRASTTLVSMAASKPDEAGLKRTRIFAGGRPEE